MQHGGTATADVGSKSRMEWWTLEALRFAGDFWLLFLLAFLLGLLFVALPQSTEVWVHYILSPLPTLAQSGWVLLHALLVVASLLFMGIVCARYAQHKLLLRQSLGRGPVPWVVAAAAFLPLVLVLAGVCSGALAYRSVGEVRPQMLVAAGVTIGLIALAIVAIVVLARTQGAAALADWVGRTRRRMAVSAIIVLIVFLVLPLLPPAVFIGTAQVVGAVPAMLFAVGLVIYAIDSAFRTTGYRKVVAVGALAIVGLGILFGDLATAHRVRRVGTIEKDFPDVGSEFLRWLETRKDRDRYEAYPVFVVAAQGGGIYAAYHTARVLAVLQDNCPAFAQHVFAISGVSGGSLGAAVFASGVKGIAPEQTLEPCRTPGSSQRFLEYTDRFLKRDFLSPLGFLAVIPSIAQRVAGLPSTIVQWTPRPARRAMRPWLRGISAYDRALGLEYGLEQAWRQTSSGKAENNFFAAPSVSTWTGEDAVPALVLNATRADTGVTYSVAPFRLDTDENLDFRAKVLGVEAKHGGDVPISTAVVLSARYPIATGPGMITVESRKWLKDDDSMTETVGLVDGGFVENSGLATLGKLLREIHNAVAERGKRKIAIHVVAIQDLSAFTYSHSGVEQPGMKPALLPESLRDIVEQKDLNHASQPVRLGFAEFTAPLTALDASRVARSFYSLNSLIENVMTLRCAQGVGEKDDPCTFAGTSRSGKIVDVPVPGSALFGITASNHPLPLGWQLSSLSQLRIEKRTWPGKDEGWSCQKRLVIPNPASPYQAMNDANLAELRALGEDLGGFVDRWIYACGREHVSGLFKPLEK
jgi:MFS family permease